MSRKKRKELIEILRIFVYLDKKRSDRWIKERSLYQALADLLAEKGEGR